MMIRTELTLLRLIIHVRRNPLARELSRTCNYNPPHQNGKIKKPGGDIKLSQAELSPNMDNMIRIHELLQARTPRTNANTLGDPSPARSGASTAQAQATEQSEHGD